MQLTLFSSTSLTVRNPMQGANPRTFRLLSGCLLLLKLVGGKAKLAQQASAALVAREEIPSGQEKWSRSSRQASMIAASHSDRRKAV